jgi:exodeoxyribonuclease VII large subunit
MTAMNEAPRELPARALDTTAERPWPVRVLSSKITQYIDKMSPVWVEGQVVELNRRSGTYYLTLRDTIADMSLPVSLPARVVAGLDTPVGDGAHVVVHAKATFWPRRGTFQLHADALRPVGVGELLARIEHLKRVLAAEGLFAPERKVALPFLPHVVGLVCGRDSKAEHDVVVNARARWPAVRFEIREVAVQGGEAVGQIIGALAELDADPRVQVIVVARGGGAVEDLLPFSNEALVRAAAACRTPIVSAIGHETDAPIFDLVADIRASTPTDAAKLVVPDVVAEAAALQQARRRMRAALEARLAAEQDRLDAVRTRPSLAQPDQVLAGQDERVRADRQAARRAFRVRIDAATAEVARLAGQVRALSPAATLERGYAVLRHAGGEVVRSPTDTSVGDLLEAVLAHGRLDVRVESVREHGPSAGGNLVEPPALGPSD